MHVSVTVKLLVCVKILVFPYFGELHDDHVGTLTAVCRSPFRQTCIVSYVLTLPHKVNPSCIVLYIMHSEIFSCILLMMYFGSTFCLCKFYCDVLHCCSFALLTICFALVVLDRRVVLVLYFHVLVPVTDPRWHEWFFYCTRQM